jgi:hypothetical protein
MPMKNRLFTSLRWTAFVLAVFLLVLVWRTGSASSRLAAPGEGMPALSVEESQTIQWNHSCMMCHQSEKLKGLTKNSMMVSLQVEDQVIARSVHGRAGLTCDSCHTTLDGYPHHGKEQVTCMQCHADIQYSVVAQLPYEDFRHMKAELSKTCTTCHTELAHARTMHSPVLDRGDQRTPLCIDCHGGHDVQKSAGRSDRVNSMCSGCHSLTEQAFKDGAHGSGAASMGAACTACHTAHEAKGQPTVPASPPTEAPVAAENPHFISEWDKSCTMCHDYPNLSGTARNLEVVSLTVTGQEYAQSVHGKAALGCASCHAPITGYPHQETGEVACSACHGSEDGMREVNAVLPYPSRRALSIRWNEACSTCHADQYNRYSSSMHKKNYDAGNQNAPLCIDCHGSHSIKPAGSGGSAVTQTCSSCHTSVYTSFAVSVHGADLERGVADAPNCGDCHGVHDVTGPRSPDFRTNITATCNGCHLNPEIMSKFGVSAEIYSPHMDRYHGITAGPAGEQASVHTRSAVQCYDCHGSHSTRKTGDPLSTVNPANLLATCQKCHPEADSSFVGIWSGHIRPGTQDRLANAQVNEISFILFSFFGGSMVVYLGLDARKRWIEKQDLLRAIKKDK